MQKTIATGLGALFLVVSAARAFAAGPWEGEWVTDLGPLTFSKDGGGGSEVSGTYAAGGTFTGKRDGAKLEVEWSEGNASGKATFEMATDGLSWKGTWTRAGDGGAWRGWRPDPEGAKAKDVDFSGVWLSSLGTLQLEQKGKRVTGRYGAQGWATLEGEVQGRRLAFTWKRLQGSGPAWLEQTPDGQRLFGLTGGTPPTTWLGVRLKGFERHVKPKPGQVVEGRTDQGLLYFVSAPKSWKKGKPTDVIVLLHGSNWTTKGMVHVTARNQALAERYLILGIQGEQWATWSDPDDLRFNYTYVNWMGKSTYKGYPYTDRESPFLVVQAIDELRAEYGLGRVFVGGHSQGGFLTYILHMHYPEKWAGTFPMAGGVVMQAEPDVFADEKPEEQALRAAQRACPLAIVHGTADQVVPFATGLYAHDRFLTHSFPALRLFAPPLNHGFDSLPLADVIAWLDALSTKDVAVLAAFANAQADAGVWRDVAAALARAKALKAEAKFADVERRLAKAAAKDADQHLAAIQKNADGTWVETFLVWYDQFEFVPAARPVVEAFRALRAAHDGPAKKLIEQARAAFRANNADEGWAKYGEVVEKHYAATQAGLVRRWIAERK